MNKLLTSFIRIRALTKILCTVIMHNSASELLKAGIYFVSLICFLFVVPGLAAAASVTCAQSKVTVAAETIQEIESVCATALNGITYLMTIGLNLSGRLNIRLTKVMPINGFESAIGQYDSRSNEIYLLDYKTALSRSRRSPPAFGVPMNPAIWHGYVVHELAHAAAHDKFVTGVSVLAANEYIASVAQFATLPCAERDKIVRNYQEISGFEKAEEITYGYYLLDPSRFAVNAYLHFSRPENGLTFIKRLLREGLPGD